LFDESLAVQVTVVVPIGNTEGALFVIAGAKSRSSVTIGMPRKLRTVKGPAGIVVMSVGAINNGGIVSGGIIVTVCIAVETLSEKSVAVQMTVVVPNGKPSAVALLVTVGDGSALSPTIGDPSDTDVSALVDSILILGGGVIDGPIVSKSTIMTF
jgi:hypothetical protein